MKNQTEIVAQHLKDHGSITNVEANAVYKIRSVTSRVAELRKSGRFLIQSKRCKDATGQRYVKYVLEGVTIDELFRF